MYLKMNRYNCQKRVAVSFKSAYITDLIMDCKLRAKYNSILFQRDFDIEKDTKKYSNRKKTFDIYTSLLSLKHNKDDTKITKIWNKYYHQFRGYCHLNDINKFINIFEFCVKNLYGKPVKYNYNLFENYVKILLFDFKNTSLELEEIYDIFIKMYNMFYSLVCICAHSIGT